MYMKYMYTHNRVLYICIYIYIYLYYFSEFYIFIEFVTVLFLFYILVFWSTGMWDLSTPTRDQTPCIGG